MRHLVRDRTDEVVVPERRELREREEQDEEQAGGRGGEVARDLAEQPEEHRGDDPRDRDVAENERFQARAEKA